MLNKLLAEVIGTFWLVLAGCGSAVLSFLLLAPRGSPATSFQVGIGLLGVALAFGLSVTTMAYAVGHISGGHFNPAVTIGLCVGGRFRTAEVIPYIIAQVGGAILGAGVLWFIANGNTTFKIEPNRAGEFATNFYGEQEGKLLGANYNLIACAMTEVVLTFVFLIVILGATDGRAPAGFAPLAIGLALTVIILVGGPVTNLSVNPARSTGPAVLITAAPEPDYTPLNQLWLFWAAPVGGAVLAGLVYRVIGRPSEVTR